jgi:hypothetical protein
VNDVIDSDVFEAEAAKEVFGPGDAIHSLPVPYCQPERLSEDGLAAWKIIFRVLSEARVSHPGLNCKVFRPGQGDYELVIEHDGGDHAPFFNAEFHDFEAYSKMTLALRNAGFCLEAQNPQRSIVRRLCISEEELQTVRAALGLKPVLEQEDSGDLEGGDDLKDLDEPETRLDRVRKLFATMGYHIKTIVEEPEDKEWGELGKPKWVITVVLQPQPGSDWRMNGVAGPELVDHLRRTMSNLGDVLETTDIDYTSRFISDLGAWEIVWFIGDPTIEQRREIIGESDDDDFDLKEIADYSLLQRAIEHIEGLGLKVGKREPATVGFGKHPALYIEARYTEPMQGWSQSARKRAETMADQVTSSLSAAIGAEVKRLIRYDFDSSPGAWVFQFWIPLVGAVGESHEPDQVVIQAHLSGPELVWIDWFNVPENLRGHGEGRKAYLKWERTLPETVKVVRLQAGDSGAGDSAGFWEKMGFSYVYADHKGDESDQMMWKGVNGYPTPSAITESEQADPTEIAAAAKEVETDPSDAQIEAGNYRKGHVTIHGMDISLENPKGSVRSGEDKNGKKWEVTLPAHYGYIKGTQGKDKDHIDVFIGEETDSEKVYVVNQNKLEGGFDEHKVMLCFSSKETAVETYDKAYSGDLGPKLRGSVIVTNITAFKAWLESGDTKVPFKKSDAKVDESISDHLGWRKFVQARADEARDRMLAEEKDEELKKLLSEGHGTYKGSCGHRLWGCRCPSRFPHPVIQVDAPCQECSKHVTEELSPLSEIGPGWTLVVEEPGRWYYRSQVNEALLKVADVGANQYGFSLSAPGFPLAMSTGTFSTDAGAIESGIQWAERNPILKSK